MKRGEKQGTGKKYSQHTINIGEDNWAWVLADSEKRDISKSRVIGELINNASGSIAISLIKINETPTDIWEQEGDQRVLFCANLIRPLCVDDKLYSYLSTHVVSECFYIVSASALAEPQGIALREYNDKLSMLSMNGAVSDEDVDIEFMIISRRNMHISFIFNTSFVIRSESPILAERLMKEFDRIWQEIS